MAFVVRTEADPYSVVPSLRRAVAELDPDAAARRAEDDGRAPARGRCPSRASSRRWSTAFGALAVTLALIGIYAMMAWSVSERRQEFAIRLALGARGPLLVRMVLRKALLLAAVGHRRRPGRRARAATGVLTGLLFGDPADRSVARSPLTAAVVALVALAACYVPVRRALRVDPVSLLR